MDENSTKILYELSRLTNKPKQITTDFIETITLLMFREFINTLPNKEDYLDQVLAVWEKTILAQKKSELELLIDKDASLFELVAGSIIANSENFEEFSQDVTLIKDLMRDSLIDT